jgi:mannose-1-phosphate guanylyltransferase
MQAMVLAAGMGSRLMPLTGTLPKPLFPVLNRPNLERTVAALAAKGFSRIIINAFHLGHLIEKWCAASPFRDIVHVVREDKLLGTGGGLKNALSFFSMDSPVLVVNSDVVTDIDFALLPLLHETASFPASLVVHDRKPFNNVRLQDGVVTGFRYEGPDAVAFTGISVIAPEEIAAFPCEKGSLVEIFSQVIVKYGGCNAIELATLCPGGYIWEDIGSVAGYLHGHELLSVRGNVMVTVGQHTVLPDDLDVVGWACMGAGVTVGRGVRLVRTVVWDGVNIADNVVLEDAVCTPEFVVTV